jgi:hypothetical protein
MSTLESIADDVRTERKAIDREAVARLQDDLEQLGTLYALSENRVRSLESENERLRGRVVQLPGDCC